MAQNRKKSPQRTAKPDRLQAMHDVQATAASFGSEGIQTAAGLADNISYATSECMGICATGMEAWLQSCAMSVRTIHEIADEVLKNQRHAGTNMTRLLCDMFACRSMEDVIGLQGKATERLYNNMFEETGKFTRILSESYNASMKPFNLCTTT